MADKKTVIVGMSGGVDSSVAAYLLKEQGYDVIGVTMHLFDDVENNSCCGVQGIEDARNVCEVLGIPHYVMNFKSQFKEQVIDYFVNEYQQGHTPNPCIACNRHIKWHELLNRARAIGADYLATGHYAQVEQLANGRFAVKKSVTDLKDQTYALYNLTQEQLAHTLMPIGAYEKEEVRRIAKELNLPVAQKPDSQDICFVTNGDYASVVNYYSGKKDIPGNFVGKDGEIFGKHQGIIHYTIGQRKGLGIAFGKPKYVTKINPSTNEVVLGDEEDLWVTRLTAHKINCMGTANFEKGQRMMAKIRYAHKGEQCIVEEVGEDTVTIVFEKPVRAVTPGQALVCYDGDIVLGGGEILG